MSFILITSANINDERINNLSENDKLLVIYKTEDKLNIETMKEFEEKNIQISFISNQEDKIGYAAIFKLGELVERENIKSLLLYDDMDQEIIDALKTCGIDVKTEDTITEVKDINPKQADLKETIVETVKRRGRKPGSKNKPKIAI